MQNWDINFIWKFPIAVFTQLHIMCKLSTIYTEIITIAHGMSFHKVRWASIGKNEKV